MENERPPDVIAEGLVAKLEALLPKLEGPGPHSELVQPPPREKERFCEGHLVQAAERGDLAAIVRRLPELLNEP